MLILGLPADKFCLGPPAPALKKTNKQTNRRGDAANDVIELNFIIL